jgi:crossover junction endodeoxyribonuclease RuvC
MRVLAIDPGYERMGVAILERPARGKDELLYSDCIKTSASLEFADRLTYLGRELSELIKKWRPDSVATEKLFFTTNQKTGIHIAEIRGMIIFITRTADLALYEYTPLEIKTAIAGYGKADKKQVATMVRALISLKKIPKYDDEYDAIAIGLTYLACLARHLSPRQ